LGPFFFHLCKTINEPDQEHITPKKKAKLKGRRNNNKKVKKKERRRRREEEGKSYLLFLRLQRRKTAELRT